MTWPQLRVIGTDALDDQDVYLDLWRLRWIAHALTTSGSTLFDANIFVPEHGVLAYSDAMLVEGVIAAPLLWLGVPPVLVHNLMLLGAIAASGIAAFFLARHLTGSGASAVVAGLIFAFAPYRFAHYAHLELQWVVWSPCAFWGLQRTIETRSVKFGLLTGLFLALQMLSSVYYGVFLSVLIVTVALPQVISLYGRQLVRTGAAVAWVWPSPRASRSSTPGPMRTRLRVWAYADSRGQRVQREARRLSHRDTHKRALRQAGSRFARASVIPRHSSACSGGGGVAAPTSDDSCDRVSDRIGCGVRALSRSAWSALSAAFRTLLGVPRTARAGKGFRIRAFISRCPGRIRNSGTYVGNEAVDSPRRRSGRVCDRASQVSSWGAAARRHPTLHLDSMSSSRSFLRASLLNSQCPRPAARRFTIPRFAYMSTFHWQRLVNGYSGFYPPSFLARLKRVARFPDEESVASLRREHVRYIVVTLSGYPEGERPRIVDRLETLGLRHLGEYDDGWGRGTVMEMNIPVNTP